MVFLVWQTNLTEKEWIFAIKQMQKQEENDMELKEYGKKWVAKNLGEEYVAEFEHNYDDLNRGIEIGGFAETSMFLDLIDAIRKDKEEGVEV